MDDSKLPPVLVADREIGIGLPVYVIAEIGSNHGCSLQRAKELMAACAQAGADAVKFQSWSARALQNCKQLDPNGDWSKSQVLPVLEKLQLPDEWHQELADFCRIQKVHFLSTPFDIGHARLILQVGAPAMKVSSSDLVYDELLEEVGSYGLPVLLSTGMADLGEIEHALECLGRARADIILLHCVAAYPPVYEDMNLRAILTLQQTFGLQTGFSDHLPGHEAVLAAVALGACVVEKHVTFSRGDNTPDSFFSLEIEEFRAMVEAIRRIETALGDGIKRCRPSEAGGLINGRRALFSGRDLHAGQILTREDIAVVRPNLGELKPKDLKSILGRRLKKPLPQGVPIRWEHLEP